MIILEENFKWHLEAFASELFICSTDLIIVKMCVVVKQYLSSYQGFSLPQCLPKLEKGFNQLRRCME